MGFICYWDETILIVVAKCLTKQLPGRVANETEIIVSKFSHVLEPKHFILSMVIVKQFKGNQGSHTFCFNTSYFEDEPSLGGPMHPMQSTIRVHPSHGPEQGDIDCFRFSGDSQD